MRHDTESSVFRSGFGRHGDFITRALVARAPTAPGPSWTSGRPADQHVPKAVDWAVRVPWVAARDRRDGGLLRRQNLIPDPPTRQFFFLRVLDIARGYPTTSKIRPFGSPPLAPLPFYPRAGSRRRAKPQLPISACISAIRVDQNNNPRWGRNIK